jgi:hypothetical protein
VTIVYTGTLNTSNDYTGMFGVAPNTSLTGLAVSLTYVFDTSLGISDFSSTSNTVHGAMVLELHLQQNWRQSPLTA